MSSHTSILVTKTKTPTFNFDANFASVLRRQTYKPKLNEAQSKELAFLLDALDFLKISMAVYGKNPEGYPQHITPVSNLDLNKMGLKADDFHYGKHEKSPTGLQARLYFDNRRDQFILAYRGSESNSVDEIVKDWVVADLGNAAGGLTWQYLEGVALAKKVNAAVKKTGKNLIFTGHSLGGGLAELAAIATHRSATTFNAAGVNNLSVATLTNQMSILEAVVDPFVATRKNYKGIFSIYVEGEMVSTLQDKRPLLASAKGKRYGLKSVGSVPGIDFLIDHTVERIRSALLVRIEELVKPKDKSIQKPPIAPLQDNTYVDPVKIRPLEPEFISFIFQGKILTIPNPKLKKWNVPISVSVIGGN